MTKVPSVNYKKVVNAFKRDGWVVVRQKGSHIRLEKFAPKKISKITIPAHNPIKRSTLSHILKYANLTIEEFLELL
ncbi:MAG: type II toxin-antitoxin system HicA family toxin [Candidatus Marinimicrobia bacterium]|nr:type II toxin-antitoxin system HicA family toxin [Candidatus Neomarinimicrobiota bacterium]